MRVLIAGGTGLVGSALRTSLEADGHTCVVLSRRDGENRVRWNPAKGEVDAAALGDIDAAVNLAGSNIACRWTNSAKQVIHSSRVDATALLARTLAALCPRPRVLVNASAIGYYGIAPTGLLSESSPAGDNFLAAVCKAWEAATLPAADAGIRTVLLRTGIVLTPRGGALKKMLPAFKAGVGGPLADGQQWMSWIALNDLIGLIRFCLANDAIEGALNAVALEPVTNAQFSNTLGQELGRPARIKIPPAMLRLMFGQMAEETLLSSAQCSADKALRAGYVFRFPALGAALRHMLANKQV